MKLLAIRYVGRIGGLILSFLSFFAVGGTMFPIMFRGAEEISKTESLIGLIAPGTLLLGMLFFFLAGRIPASLVRLELSGSSDVAWAVIHSKTGVLLGTAINSRWLSWGGIIPGQREFLEAKYPIYCILDTRYQGESLQLSGAVVVELDENVGLVDLFPTFVTGERLQKTLESAVAKKLESVFPEIKVGSDKLENQRYLQGRIQEIGAQLEGVPYHISLLKFDLDAVVVG